MSGKAVSTSSSNFLYISFETRRHIVVNYCPNVRLIDSHAESDRRHNDPCNSAHKRLLYSLTTMSRKSRVIRLRYAGHLLVHFRLLGVLSVRNFERLDPNNRLSLLEY